LSRGIPLIDIQHQLILREVELGIKMRPYLARFPMSNNSKVELEKKKF
jgi:hypothetical protein